MNTVMNVIISITWVFIIINMVCNLIIVCQIKNHKKQIKNLMGLFDKLGHHASVAEKLNDHRKHIERIALTLALPHPSDYEQNKTNKEEE